MSQTNAREAYAGSDAFVRERVTQISQLLQLVDNEKLVPGEVTHNPRTLLQRLPRHMRRRAMNKNFKRFPRRLHTTAKSFITTPYKKKPPSRFARRRTRCRLMAYFRRRKCSHWLETHVWHAKRFRMTERWGYKLPLKSFQHAFRPIHRASLRSCCIRDMSYLSVFAIRCSSQETILKKINALSLSNSGLKFSHNKAGLHELSILLYDPELKPQGFIGPARFSWIRLGSQHCLILWIHPATHKEILKHLIAIFELKPENQQDEETKQTDSKKIGIQKQSTVKYTGSDGVEVEDLRNQLSRFRLFGPRSLETIQKVFKLVDLDPQDSSSKLIKENWEKISRKEPLIDGSFFSFPVQDVRLNMYSKKTHSSPNSDLEEKDFVGKTKVIPSLFNNVDRIAAIKKRVTTASFDSERKNFIFNNVAAKVDNQIPIQVITRSKGTGCFQSLDGAEVVAPSEFAMDIWMAFQYHACAASSLHDHEAAHLESSSFLFPTDVPDCRAGDQEFKRIADELEERELARPFNKRIPYWSRFSIRFPFTFEWNLLAQEWGAQEDSYVLRDRSSLVALENWFVGRVAQFPIDLKDTSTLVPVKIRMLAGGVPKRFSILCIPNEDDLKSFGKNPRTKIEQPRSGQMEVDEKMDVADEKVEDSEERLIGFDSFADVISLDPVGPSVKISIAAMFPKCQIVEKSMKRKLLNAKKKAAAKRRKTEAGLRAARAQKEDEEKVKAGYRTSANREICGRVVRGDFTFTESRGVGIGFLPIGSLAVIPKYKNKRVVLVRNTSSKFYRLATISILQTSTEI
ncbi:unnamed protein product, partial [Mesorhabditis belari]|uniref:Ribonucleases P/MRP protein subunit POP1 n=1 Tax=Mesorhabditis belari TaxID=2138241 RepID=A0AAF3F0I7_9BILA